MRRESGNNNVTLIGKIVEDFEYSHTVLEEKFYKTKFFVMRSSGTSDIVPLIVSEKLVDEDLSYTNREIRIEGQVRTYNKIVEDKNKLFLAVFVKWLDFVAEGKVEDDVITKNNEIILDGYLCKDAIYRKTPFGKEISDVIVAVNRPYRKTDYIPCICWGCNALWVSRLEVGTHVKIVGRIQSREYIKKLSDTESETRVAYEVSVERLIKVSDDN